MMHTTGNKSVKIIVAALVVFGIIVYMSSSHNSVVSSSQNIAEAKIQTLKITKTYQDFIANESLNHAEAPVISLPAGIEVISAFMNVRSAFALPGNPLISGNLTMQTPVDNLSFNNFEVSNVGYSSAKDNSTNYGFLFMPAEIRMNLDSAGGTDLNNLTAGVVDVYINYYQLHN